MLAAALGWAQDDDQHPKLMKQASASMKSLKKNLDAKMQDDAAKDATQISEVFKQEEQIWTKSNTADAMKWCKDAQAAASDIASGSGDSAANFKALGATCQGCHAAHREKSADGAYKVKP